MREELREASFFRRDHKTIFPLLLSQHLRVSVNHLSVISPPTSRNRHLDALRAEWRKRKKKGVEPRGYAVITINDYNYTYSRPRAAIATYVSRFPVSRYSAHRALKKKRRRVTCASELSFSRSGKRDAEVRDSKPCELDRMNARARAHGWMRDA